MIVDGEGRGRGRGGRGRGGDRGRGGRRPFDRHSATGKTYVFFFIIQDPSDQNFFISDSDKKVHQGWGGDEGNAELKAEAAAETDAQAEAAAPAADGWGETAAGADVWAAPAEGAEGAAPAEGEKAESRPRREEEEDNTLTLDEYIKNQKKDLDIIPKLEARKANEGDDTIWKDAVVVTKKNEEEDAYFVGKVCILSLQLLLRSDDPLRPKPTLPSPRLRRQRRSSLRSMLASSALSVVVVVVVEVTGLPVAAVAAVVGAEVPTATTQVLRWTSTTRRRSHPCLNTRRLFPAVMKVAM